jgi:amino acid transporter
MDSIPFILVGILFLVILLAVAFFVFKKKNMAEPDYYSFFIMGIIWLAAGIPLGNTALMIMGLVFTALGLANRNKWKKQKKWGELTGPERNVRIILIAVLVFFALLGIVVYLLVEQGLVAL